MSAVCRRGVISRIDMIRPSIWQQGISGGAILCLLGLATAWAAPASQPRQEAREPSASLPISSGVYSEDQATRGLQAYTESCEHCHESDMTGNPTDEVPALVADAFMFHWRGRSVLDLYNRVSRTMPADAPGSLDAGIYLDVVAYILEANEFPRGQSDLEYDRLAGIVIERSGSR